MSNTQCNNCKRTFEPYDYTLPGCLRPKDKDCVVRAIVASKVVENKTDLKDIRDAFVHVNNTNTTYYLDGQGYPMTVWSGLVEFPLYDLDKNELNLRAQWLMTTRLLDEQTLETIFVYYDKNQDYFIFKPNEMKARNQ